MALSTHSDWGADRSADTHCCFEIGIIFGLGGLTGLAYQINVVIKRHQFGLALHDWHDWLPYVGVPALGSACLVVGAVGLIVGNALAPYAVAGATTLLLIGGVYGAWDRGGAAC
jgi:ABC-type transporter lipoprotein component MlaA